MSPATILAATAFTGATSLSLGLLVLQALRVPLRRSEAVPLAYVVGSGVLSLLVFASLTFWIARPAVFAALGVCAIGGAIWKRAWRFDNAPALAPVPAGWRWIFSALFATYGVFTFAHALAPDISPDGVAYHLGTVYRWFRAGGFEWHTTNMYANMPMAVETLFLFAFSFGRHSAAALVHWQFYLVLPLLVLNAGRRFGHPVAGCVGGLLVFISPVAAVDGASSYVDVATTAVLVAMFVTLLLFEDERHTRLLFLAGGLGGFAYACKMTAFPALPFALLYGAWLLRRHRVRLLKPLAVATAAGALFIAPWLLKSALMVGNPFSPFFNRYFPNPHVRVSFEEEYRALHRDYYGRIKSWKEIPLEVTLRGAKLQGLIGPVFLLAPIALLALRWRLGRRALLATAVFSLAYPSNIGARFLLLPLPFLALAMGLTLAHWRGAAGFVVLFHALMSWPPLLREYVEPYAWRLDNFRWREALRIDSEQGFFTRYAPTVLVAQMIEEKVPAHGRVLGFGSVAEAYTSRDILVVYQAGLNNLLGDILVAGYSPAQQGSQKMRFQFAPVRLRKLRVVQTAAIAENWGVSEMRIFAAAGGELPRTHAWKLRAHPNPWEVQLAFDNCPVTRWLSWQASRPGDYIEVDVTIPFEIAGVQVEVAPDQANARMRVEGEIREGVWQTLAKDAQLIWNEPVRNSRLTAADDLKRFGITHLAISTGDFVADELARNMASWGISLVGETGGVRLYRLD